MTEYNTGTIIDASANRLYIAQQKMYKFSPLGLLTLSDVTEFLECLTISVSEGMFKNMSDGLAKHFKEEE